MTSDERQACGVGENDTLGTAIAKVGQARSVLVRVKATSSMTNARFTKTGVSPVACIIGTWQMSKAASYKVFVFPVVAGATSEAIYGGNQGNGASVVLGMSSVSIDTTGIWFESTSGIEYFVAFIY